MNGAYSDICGDIVLRSLLVAVRSRSLPGQPEFADWVDQACLECSSSSRAFPDIASQGYAV
jgi:hypothetical protein